MNLKLATELDRRVLKLKISILTATVIAMILKLDYQEGIYISSEEEVTFLPDDTGHILKYKASAKYTSSTESVPRTL